MNWMQFVTTACAIYALLGAWTAMSCVSLMYRGHLSKREYMYAAIITAAWLAAAGFVAWRLFSANQN